ncbi:MAG TPA: metallophosphoesterase [Roseimicrobium sp.]|nr:metallophosphoesterase [Roseimicrobium sp.]
MASPSPKTPNRPSDGVNRRRFIWATLASLPVAALINAFWLEPTWLKTRTIRLSKDTPRHRLVHFTDLHHKGERGYLERVVRKINALSPDAVCFTGDLVEESKHLPEALEILRGIKSPLYGVPGNHDYWSHIDFEPVRTAFRATGGAWLMDEEATAAGGRIRILGATCERPVPFSPKPDVFNVLLMHYPLWADKLDQRKFDLMLAGHSHGGQIRLPWLGALIVPYQVGSYECGLFQTPAGPLYVNPGLGWFMYRLRFNCRPEITVFEV